MLIAGAKTLTICSSENADNRRYDTKRYAVETDIPLDSVTQRKRLRFV